MKKYKEITEEIFYLGIYENGNGDRVLQCSEDKDCLSNELTKFLGSYKRENNLLSIYLLLFAVIIENGDIHSIEINTNSFYHYNTIEQAKSFYETELKRRLKDI